MGKFRWLLRPASLVVACCVMLLSLRATPARAASTLSITVDAGWGGQVHSGRWMPVYITLADPAAPARGSHVRLGLRVPQGAAGELNLHETAWVQSYPQTWTLLTPLPPQLNDVVLTVSDADTGRTIESQSLVEYGSALMYRNNPLSPGQILVGVSGNRPIPGLHLPNRNGEASAVAFLDPIRLPNVAAGYDGLDVLVLNEANSDKIPADSQRAIAAWVRGGGNLLVQALQAPPAAGPLADLLPGKLGPLGVLNLSHSQLDAAWLPERYGKLSTRPIAAESGATTVGLIAGEPAAVVVWGRRGLGRVGVLGFDAAALTTAQTDAAEHFWQAALAGAIHFDPSGTTANDYHTFQDAGRAEAIRQTMDLLGSVEGVGRFDFTYVALVLIGMMVVVGPLDYFVLRAMRRQAWTWVTTTGWIGLITFGGLYMGHVFRSGDLHYRTLRLVDRADGVTVAQSQVVGLYAPRTTTYGLAGGTGEWWSPASPETYSYRRKIANEYACEQSLAMDFNHVQPFEVNVWNLRFLLAESFGGAGNGENKAADFDLSLAWDKDKSRLHDGLKAKLTNNRDVPLKYLVIRTKAFVFDGTRATQPGWTPARQSVPQKESQGVRLAVRPRVNGEPEFPLPPQSALDEVPAHATISFHAGAGIEKGFLEHVPTGQNYGYGYGYGYENANSPIVDGDPASVIRAASQLSTRRFDQIERLLRQDENLACVYALYEDDDGATKIQASMPAKEKHWQVVRVLVPIR